MSQEEIRREVTINNKERSRHVFLDVGGCRCSCCVHHLLGKPTSKRNNCWCQENLRHVHTFQRSCTCRCRLHPQLHEEVRQRSCSDQHNGCTTEATRHLGHRTRDLQPKALRKHLTSNSASCHQHSKSHHQLQENQTKGLKACQERARPNKGNATDKPKRRWQAHATRRTERQTTKRRTRQAGVAHNHPQQSSTPEYLPSCPQMTTTV